MNDHPARQPAPLIVDQAVGGGQHLVGTDDRAAALPHGAGGKEQDLDDGRVRRNKAGIGPLNLAANL